MATKMKITDLKKVLKNADKDELEMLICELYKKDGFAEILINCKLFGDEFEKQILTEYKDKMEMIFFPNNLSRGFSLSGAKKLIADYKKISNNSQYLLDLTLYYVECGTDFTNSFGDIDMPFYNSLMSVFDKFTEELYKQDDEKMYLLFKDRLARLSNDVGSIGWGYCDYMQEEILNLECFFMEEEDND
ncbi:DUF6155 family protein [Anaerobium acetethylicum]|uniref:Uncharacterized protein n=1 Tax=Anaerobium acetethylicum TaxID=1619234 RepID=A0A1D3TWD1_9FIRM|nr:DUF6155 family protein [Anaerobium acetethylicum]SCP98553.1 hypothetical protein SAMN05421730_102231 [Anaerobium acetethylicum]